MIVFKELLVTLRAKKWGGSHSLGNIGGMAYYFDV